MMNLRGVDLSTRDHALGDAPRQRKGGLFLRMTNVHRTATAAASGAASRPCHESRFASSPPCTAKINGHRRGYNGIPCAATPGRGAWRRCGVGRPARPMTRTLSGISSVGAGCAVSRFVDRVVFADAAVALGLDCNPPSRRSGRGRARCARPSGTLPPPPL